MNALCIFKSHYNKKDLLCHLSRKTEKKALCVLEKAIYSLFDIMEHKRAVIAMLQSKQNLLLSGNSYKILLLLPPDKYRFAD